MKDLENFLSTSVTRRFNRGQTILAQGEEIRQAYIVKTGIVKFYDLSGDGSQQLIWLGVAGEIFPLPYLLNDEPAAKVFYSAFSDTEVYVIKRVELLTFLRSNPDRLFDLCKYIARSFSDLHFRVNAAGKPKAKEKILHTLAFIADRFRLKTSSDDRVALTLPLTHQDIASLVGLTRETTSLILGQLKNDRLIDYNAHRFVVYRKKINQLLWGS